MSPVAKRRKVGNSRDEPQMKQLEGRVFQVAPTKKSSPTSIEANCYQALKTPGALIPDNTEMLGRVDDGALLQSNRRLYLGFASPSDHSVTQMATSLMAYHDTYAKDLYPLFKSFHMSEIAAPLGGLPCTHACLDINFSSLECENVETAQLFEEKISSTVRSAMIRFARRYTETYSLPTDKDLSGLPRDLKSFLPWLPKIDMKLFVTVRNMDRIFGRFLNAAMWERYYKEGSSTLNDRLGAIREHVLEPLWEHLDENGVVKKLLLAGPFLLEPLIQPPDPTKYNSLPVFSDLSSHDSLHGYTPPQIRTLYQIDRKKVPSGYFEQILDLCNCVVRPVCDSPIFTPDSVDTVFNGFQAHLDKFKSLPPATVQKRFCDKYLTVHRDRVLGALYPVLRVDKSFLAVAKGLLKGQTLTRGHCSFFSLASLISASTREQKAERLFLTGLLTKVQPEDGNQPDYYTLAGGCARALLEDAVTEAKKSYDRKRVNVDSFISAFFTEDTIAKLILEHYRNVPFDRLPKDEPAFQAELAEILRAALEKCLGEAGFPSDVQLEVWLKDNRPERLGARNLRFDIAIRLRSFGPNGADKLFILELKYFNLEDTQKATYAHLDKLNNGRNARDRMVLDSRNAVNSSARFANELRSILPKTLEDFSREAARKSGAAAPKKVPVHWHTHAGPPPCTLRFAFSPEHIQCDYKEYPPKPSPQAAAPKPVRKVKTAVEVVQGVGDQAANYGAAAERGVADQLGHGEGFADARFTDLGAGKTVVICFSIINIAGALVYVKAHGQRLIRRRLGIVGAFPWSHDPTEAETTAILDAKRKLDAKKS